ncbi:hypothetical protein AVEN_16959-1 [Araneus ventricosus]|uniref:Uncharacterized protein n=1 Tax=Araneus ventricosus TaxID=182803 RepID=A0A4Y2D4F5_ARAVE|nr:hypothetical protein AVEN_16959-1 [Araneus ventricosus]
MANRGLVTWVGDIFFDPVEPHQITGYIEVFLNTNYKSRSRPGTPQSLDGLPAVSVNIDRFMVIQSPADIKINRRQLVLGNGIIFI